MKTYILVAVIINCIYHGHAIEERQARSFALFNVVKFRNTMCQATSSASLQGTCYTAQECTDMKGTADGNCASSFGVCCVIRKSTCGSVAKENCTFIESPGFPSTLTAGTTKTCSYTVTPNKHTDICQIRLDFTLAVTPLPVTTTGVCTTDKFTITPGATPTTSSGVIPPVLCGTLTGHHLSVDSAMSTTAATIKFETTATTFTTQKWRIKVSQIECGSKYAPPNGCLQYFMGNGGTVKSFNWDGGACTAGGCFLSNQEYTACFKQEKGMCGIQFAETTTAATTTDPFLLTNAATVAASETTGCTTGGVVIYSAASDLAGDFYCGSNLSPFSMKTGTEKAATAGAVASSTFELRVLAAATQNALPGFSLDYTLLPC